MNDKDMDTAIYETEAEMTRERIASTVDDLQTRLSPRRIMDDAVGSARDRGTELMGSATRAVSDNLLPLALAGTALGIVLILRARSQRSDGYDAYYDEAFGYDAGDEVDVDYGYDESADEQPSRLRRGFSSMRSGMSSVRDRVSSAGSAVGERAGSARDYASETWTGARERTADYASRARMRASATRQRAAQSYDQNPMIGLIVGIAAGAIAGALLPRTQKEDQLLGETRDRLADAARQAARAAADAGKQQLDQMGLNADTAKTKLADIGQQAKEAARTAAQTGADELKNRVTPQSGSTGGSMAYNAAGAGGSMGSTGSTGGSLSGDTPGLSTTNPTPTL
jgi:ElaB/YqjD/DUF883 family membrane-anchored ribosome-binding protein